MKIAVACPNCQSKYQVEADRLGTAASCKSCGQRFTLAVAADETLGTAAEGGVGKRSLPVDAKPSSLGSAVPSQSDSIRIGRYEIRQRLGAGAFGTVYRAYDPVLDRDVALKVPQAAILDTPGACDRFLREAKAAARLHHPHIVPVHDAGQDGSGVFIAAAFIEGQTLAAAIAARPLEQARAIDIVAKLADALHAAHQAGIVHRDVKPANVMLDRRGEPQLMDFGLAQVASASAQLTQKGMLLGTPCYMSPEQAMGETDDIGPASDQYSLGVMLYELLCRRLPFEGPPLAVLYQVREKTPDPPRSIDSSVPPALESICLRAMSKRAADRFADCGQLAQALRQVAGPVSAARPAPIPMAPRVTPTPSVAAPTIAHVPSAVPRIATAWLRIARDRRMAIAAGVLGVLLVLGVVIIVRSRNGDVRIETSNPTARVTVNDGRITVETDPADAPEAADSRPADEPASTVPPPAADGIEPPPAIAPFGAEQAKDHQRKWAAYLGVPVEYENSIGMKFALVPPGEFTMGNPPEEAAEAIALVAAIHRTQRLQDMFNSAVPQHRVVLTKPVFMSIYEVTQDEYRTITGASPSFSASTGTEPHTAAKVLGLDTARHPVEGVSWNDAVNFCLKLSEREQLTACYAVAAGATSYLKGTGYRLPTEAQWEFACRAGTTTKWWTGDDPIEVLKAAWVNPKSDIRTYPVGELLPNPFGLYDVHGNNLEWVQDWWGPTYYQEFAVAPAIDPEGPASGGTDRVNRGGSWLDPSTHARSAVRLTAPPTRILNRIGFRPVLSVEAVQAAGR